MTRIAAACKCGYTNQNKLHNDIELLTSTTVNKMCWLFLRRSATMIGLKTQIGGKDTLPRRSDKLWRSRF